MQPAVAVAILTVVRLPLCAQAFVVDINNGPGTSFTSIAAAAAAVPDGATLTVRAGNYQQVVLIDAKSLTIVGEPGAVVVAPSVAAGIAVRNLGPGQVVVLRNLGMAASNGVAGGTLSCEHDQGLVFVDAMVGAGNRRIVAADCAALLVARSTFASPSQDAVDLTDCTAVFDACSAQQMVLTTSSVQLAQSTITGRPGILTAGGNAVTMNGGALRVLDTSLTGGSGFGAPAGLALAGTGTARISPGSTISGAAPPIAPGVAATTVAMPRIANAPANGGADLRASLTGPSGDLGVIVVALRSLPLTVPGLDPFWLDGATATVQAFGVLGGAPLTSLTAVPTAPGLTGGAFVWQGLTFAANGALAVSNPTWFVMP